jgi:hypothetical protein
MQATELAVFPHARPGVRLEAAERVAHIESEGWMLAPAVANLIGIKTGTLNKWRRLGKGPKGWRQTTPTTVHYPVIEVQRFLSGWTDADPN